MLGKLKSLFGWEYDNLNRIEISRKNLLHNYKYLTSLNRRIKIAPVLKSNAYGHDIVQIAKLLDRQKVPFFCVDSLYEAYQLEDVKIKTPVLIMGYIGYKNLETKKLPFKYAVWDIETARVIDRYQKGACIHLFIDTGMHREGVPMDELPRFLQELKNLKNIKVEGVMSHLAKGESAYDVRTKKQFETFQKAVLLVKKTGFNPQWIHLLNSPGFLNSPKFSKWNVSNLARSGKALYGISPLPGNSSLRPVLQLKTKIAQIKTLKKGEMIGYDFTYTAKKDILLGILPMGYNDGINRRLSNKGVVLVSGVPCPIIGRVSMNLTTIDLSKVENPKVGDEVVIYSNKVEDLNNIKNSAEICGTNPYELMVHFNAATKRVVID